MVRLIVEKDKIVKNLEIIRQRAGEKRIIAVVKGNGYGLGLLPFARIFRENGVNFFAVTNPKDALLLRENGFENEDILILRSTAVQSDVEDIINARAVATIGSHEAALILNGIAKERGITARAHIKIDTGMGRYGFMPNEDDKILSVYRFMENVKIEGIYTHLNIAFASRKATEKQSQTLLDVAENIRKSGFETGMVHAENSVGLMRYNFEGFDAVRVGSALTGRTAAKSSFGLEKVGRLCCNVHEMRWLQKGSTIGYGAAFRAKKPVRIAVLDAGYADGFLVERKRDVYRFRDMLRYVLSETKKWLSGGRFYVSLNGKKARVLGHVGLAHTVIDVTDIDCNIGDEAYMEVSPIMVNGLVKRDYV